MTVPEGGLALPVVSVLETSRETGQHKNKYGKDYPPTGYDHQAYMDGRN